MAPMLTLSRAALALHGVSPGGPDARVAPESPPAGDGPADAADLIRAKVVIGTLPRKTSSRTLVGPGSEHLCDGCEQLIHIRARSMSLRAHARRLRLGRPSSASC
jgi:hypothetical protein